jgi:hypothetical protein
MNSQRKDQQMKTHRPITIAACALALMVASGSTGCRRQPRWQIEAPVAEASHAPLPGVDRSTRTFFSVPAGALVTYPPGWEPAVTPDFALMLLPANAPVRSSPEATGLRWGERFISLDIPELPAIRIPGFLPMNRIRAGYIDDLREQAPHANVEVLKSPPIPGAKASLVRTTWPAEHPTHVETALLLTHADRVYIVRGRSRAEDEPATRAAFDQVVQSLNWSEQ